MNYLLDYSEYFLVYAFLGWCVEVAFAAFKHGKFVNRGFCNGPVCPIYGFGIIIVVSVLDMIKENFVVLFIGSVLLTSLLEFATGFLMEKLLHNRWWDYSKNKFNIGGYVCLRFSLIWGVACCFVVDVVHPIIEDILSVIPNVIAIPITALLGATLIFDATYTTIGVNKFNKRLAKIEELANRIHDISDKIGENVAEGTMNIMEKTEPTLKEYAEKGNELKAKGSEILDEAKQKSSARNEALRVKYLKSIEEFKLKKDALYETATRQQKRLINAFPNMNSAEHNRALTELKNRFAKFRVIKK